MSCLYDKREKLQKALEIIIIPLLCWILLVLLTHTFYDPGWSNEVFDYEADNSIMMDK